MWVGLSECGWGREKACVRLYEGCEGVSVMRCEMEVTVVEVCISPFL